MDWRNINCSSKASRGIQHLFQKIELNFFKLQNAGHTTGIPNSLHCSPKFREAAETETEFNEHHICLPLSLSYDGFTPKRTRYGVCLFK